MEDREAKACGEEEERYENPQPPFASTHEEQKESGQQQSRTVLQWRATSTPIKVLTTDTQQIVHVEEIGPCEFKVGRRKRWEREYGKK